MRLRVALLALACAAQLSIAGGTLWRMETALGGSVYRFSTAPVDPVDLFRGRYVQISFPAETVPRADDAPLAAGDTAWATLDVGADGLARPAAVLAARPASGDVVPVQVVSVGDRDATVRLAFDRFYLPEERAPELEARMRAGGARTLAVVRVRGDDAVLEDLELESLAAPPSPAPLRERLRTPAGAALPDGFYRAVEAADFGQLAPCGATEVCVAFPLELDGKPGDEVVLQGPDRQLQYYGPVEDRPGEYRWIAVLWPRAGAIAPSGEALLALLAETGAAGPTEAAYRDLRLGDAFFGVPH